MNTMQRIRSITALLLLALLLATGLQAAEDTAVARVILAVGTIEAIAIDGTVRRLQRGDPVQEGETIRSGPRGRAQLRFTDSGRMSIRPNTEIAVDEYEFEATAPPQAARSSLSLRRGGFRTATGAVAARNRAAYRVTTPFAVIGVRGTDWSAAIADLGGGENLFLGVQDGAITATNNAGSLDLGAEDPFTFARIRSFNDMPEGLDAPPPSVASTFSGDDLPPTDDGDDGAAGTGPEPDSQPSDEDGDESAASSDDDDGPGPGPGSDDDADGAGPGSDGDEESGESGPTTADAGTDGTDSDDGAGPDGGPGPDRAAPSGAEGPGPEVVIGDPDDPDAPMVGLSSPDEGPSVFFEITTNCM